MEKRVLDALYGGREFVSYRQFMQSVEVLQAQIDDMRAHKHHQLWTPDGTQVVVDVDDAERVRFSEYAEVDGYLSYRDTISDNQAKRFGRPGQDESIAMFVTDDNAYGIVAVFKNSAILVAGFPVSVINPGGSLSGTSGNDGEMTVRAHDGDLWIENRIGSSSNITLFFAAIQD